jgi:hypothetical protein
MDQKLLPKTNCPLVIRTDFDNQRAWKKICKLISAPVPSPVDEPFYAYVQFLDDKDFGGLSTEDLLARVPTDYKHSFLLVVDRATIAHPEFPILVVQLRGNRGRQFRAIPAAIQSIENNLSIANMDFFEFANAVGSDGIFRGFPAP